MIAAFYERRLMNSGTTVFSQLMQQLPWRRFQTLVDRYRGDYKIKRFYCAEHFRVMAFAQFTYRESLRDIEACLRVMRPKLYHMGIRSKVSRNTLSNANEKRDWRIYAEFAQILLSSRPGNSTARIRFCPISTPPFMLLIRPPSICA